MATFLEIQTAVLRNLIDTPTAVSAAVPDLINKSMKRLQQKHNFKVMQASQSYTTTVATRSIGSVPSDWKRARAKPYEVENNGHVRRLNFVATRTEALLAFADDSTRDDGPPRVLLEAEPSTEAGAAVFEVFPYPDGNSLYSDGEYRIVVPYWKFLTALSGDSDTNWFTTNAEFYLEFMATSEGFAIDWDEERSAFWAQKAAAEYNDVLLTDKRAWIGDLDNLAVHKGARGPQLPE